MTGTSTVTRPAIPAALEETRIVAILRRTDASRAIETARAILAGGVRAIEVTCDSDGVFEMIQAISAEFGDRMLVGAGTVLDIETAEKALKAGATYIVSPHTDAALIGAMAERGVPCVPGAFTPTEALTAWRAGAVVVKLFPSGPVGPGHLKDLRGPLRQIPFLPTGGVTLGNAPDFIAAGAWGLGIGSALVDGPLVAAGRFDELTRRAAGFIAAAAPARGQS
ncbi:MAG TPA: bifunctional 4-hydroxy-2-oxoglutarate aldolase/2-dehydro-3-deoxy-phosphogluconate aldolase [Thermomicrobiales bacterium]|jgi:2-dehydro-3-deoxyphosphogluconate aldolase/(4S)-4-hydroxy-2-oxoglutarate aldolase